MSLATPTAIRSLQRKLSPNLTAEELVAAVPQFADVANIETVRFRQVASSELNVSDMIELAERIGGAVAGGVTGAVITQGTNTIEETSFVLDLLWDRKEPIVLTGAMRHPDLPGADGPANLLASAVVAASPVARDLGCLVIFNDEVHLPLFVRKTHTTNPATFRSPFNRTDRMDNRESSAHRAASRRAPSHRDTERTGCRAASWIAEGDTR